MAKITVLHAYYGCDTGCCGHIIEVDDVRIKGFSFLHPDSNSEEDKIKFAKEIVTDELGEEHVKDLDWENCLVSYD